MAGDRNNRRRTKPVPPKDYYAGYESSNCEPANEEDSARQTFAGAHDHAGNEPAYETGQQEWGGEEHYTASRLGGSDRSSATREDRDWTGPSSRSDPSKNDNQWAPQDETPVQDPTRYAGNLQQRRRLSPIQGGDSYSDQGQRTRDGYDQQMPESNQLSEAGSSYFGPGRQVDGAGSDDEEGQSSGLGQPNGSGRTTYSSRQSR